MDIEEAIGDARRFVADTTLEDFRENRQLRYAVERTLEIVGEAVGNLSDEVKDKSEELPWRQMRGLRNVVAHAYHRVDPARIWLLVTETLPKTQQQIGSLIQEVRHDENDEGRRG